MTNLTVTQKWVIAALRKQNCHWIAAITEREWQNKRAYYIDDRVNVKGIRRKFNKGNKQAIK